MNAEETLERVRKRYDITLPSGMNVTIRLPRMRDCIFAGGVPTPVMKHLQDIATQNGDAPDLSPEEAAHITRFQDEIVLRTLVAIEGEEVDMTREAASELDQEDYDALLAYGMRTTPLAASPQ